MFAPMFNLSDGSGQTQGELGKVLEQVMGIKVDFVRTYDSYFESVLTMCAAFFHHECPGKGRHSPRCSQD